MSYRATMYNRPMSPHRLLALLLFFASALLLAACDRREVEKVVKATDVQTGWYDAGLVDGQNKLVPTVSFRLKNVSEEPIARVQVLAVFRAVNDERAWGEQLIRGIDADGLDAGVIGKTRVVRSPLGYTGRQPRAEMLKNKEFVDVKVNLLARHGSQTWAKIGEFAVERKLLTK